MNGYRYMEPQYRVGPMFVDWQTTSVNALESGISKGPPASIHGTDPAPYAMAAVSEWERRHGLAQPVVAWPDLTPDVNWGAIGRGVAGAVVALLVVALGLWIVVRPGSA